MPPPTFASYGQNGEDVVLWRALGNVGTGRYVDVGANDPKVFSVSMGFYNRGWSGITIEPDPEFAQMHRDQRPRDRMVEAVITPKDGDTVRFHLVDGTGLSTLDAGIARAHAGNGYDTHTVEVPSRRLDAILEEAGWEGLDIHFMTIDTEGSERGVLESVDLRVWRPWVLVIEATAPLSTESTRGEWEDLVVSAGYQFCLFDGVSCYYVAEERAAALCHALSYPACAHDDYTKREYRELESRAQSVPELVQQVSSWRAQAVTRWASAVAASAEAERLDHQLRQSEQAHRAEIDGLCGYIEGMHRSTSWRVTKPLRFANRLRRAVRRHR